MAKISGEKEKYFRKNKIELVESGEPYFRKVESILAAARNEIHFQTYILEEDETGHRIADALIRTAERGVKINLLIDAYGSRNLKEQTIERIRRAGVKLRLFAPLLSKGRIHFGRRLHQKILICDERIALVTGINLSNNYSGINGRMPWLDYGIVVEGEIVPSLLNICLKIWFGFSLKNLRRRFEKSPARVVNFDESYNVWLRPLENDAIRGRSQCVASYINAINKARDTVTIVGGYFLPGGRARRVLRKAIRRGVRVRVILAEKSDVGLMHRGMLYLYNWLLRNRIEIYEYLPSNVHGKVLICDDKLVSMGSYDLNNLSTYSNIELNLEIFNEPFAKTLSGKLDNIINLQCHPVTLTEMENRYSVWQRFRQWYSYRVLKIMFVLAVWLATKENEQL